VRELLRCQLRQLTPSAWALLVAAALMDEGLTFERFCQVARLEEETGLCALEELVRQGWLCEGTPAAQSAACEEYSFPGEMIRTGVSQEAGAVHRRLAQRRVSAVLQEEAEQEQGEEASLPHPASLAGHGLQKLFGWFGGPGFTRAGYLDPPLPSTLSSYLGITPILKDMLNL
jgi:hypothetical protein